LGNDYFALAKVPDVHGGTLLLLQNFRDSTQTLVRTDDATGAITWRYDPPAVVNRFNRLVPGSLDRNLALHRML